MSDIKETAPDPSSARQQKKGVKVWAFKVSAHKGAQAGKRSLVVVSQKGRSEPQELQFCTHTPKISDLTILSASASSIRVRMLVSDEAGDINMNSKEPLSSGVSAVFICLPSFISASFSGVENLVKKDAKNFVVEAAFSAGYRSRLSEDCEVTFALRDEEHNRSNELKTRLKFK